MFVGVAKKPQHLGPLIGARQHSGAKTPLTLGHCIFLKSAAAGCATRPPLEANRPGSGEPASVLSHFFYAALYAHSPLYLSRQRLSRTRRAIIPKVARGSGFPLKPHSSTARYCTVRKLNIWSAYEWRAVLHQLFAERRALHHGAISHPPLRHVAH
jgi:hypothetical protein